MFNQVNHARREEEEPSLLMRTLGDVEQELDQCKKDLQEALARLLQLQSENQRLINLVAELKGIPQPH